jgi:RHS repeat-associated protein
MKNKTLLFLIFTLLSFPAFSQFFTIDEAGTSLSLSLSGVESVEMSPDHSTISCESSSFYSSIGLSANLDFSGVMNACSGDEYPIIIVAQMGATAGVIESYGNSFEPDSSVCIDKDYKNYNFNTDGDSYSLSVNIEGGGGSNSIMTLGIRVSGQCISKADSMTVTKTTGTDYTISIRSGGGNLGNIGSANDVEGDDIPSENETTPYYPIAKDEPLPSVPGDLFDPEPASNACSSYGRPEYQVNMHSLRMTISDREFLQWGKGPEVEIKRFYKGSGYKGYFGKGWKSTLDSWILARPVLQNTEGNVTVVKPKGKNIYFKYNPKTHLFTSLNNSDSLWLEKSTLVWLSRQRELVYHFDTLRGAGAISSDTFRLSEISDLPGNKVTYSYKNGKPSTITDASNRQIVFTYDTSGYISSFALPDGRSTSYSYTNGRLHKTVDLNGIVSVFEYDSLQNIASYSVNGKKTSFTYEVIGNFPFISTITNPKGQTLSYNLNMWTTYSENSVTDAKGNTYTYDCDAHGNMTLSTDPLGHQIVYAYNNSGELIQKKMPDGSKVNYSYAKNGQISTITYGRDTARYKYDTLGHVTLYKDMVGNLFQFEYGDNGLIKKYLNPDSGYITFDYDSAGLISALHKADGRTLYYKHDAFGNISELSDDEGILYSFNYGNFGYALKSVTDALGNVIHYHHDNNGRLTEIVKPDGSTIGFTYDCCHQTGQINEYGETISNKRDETGAISSVSFPGSGTLAMQYDADQNLTSVVYPNGGTATIQYNADGMPISTISPGGDSIQYIYDNLNRISTIIDERGNHTDYQYSRNKLFSATDAKGFTRYTYRDPLGRIKTIRDNKTGSEINYEYNFRNQIVKKTISDGNKFHYNFDNTSRLTSISGAKDSISYVWNTRDLLTSIQFYNQKKKIDYRYDAASRITKITYPDGFISQQKYDNSGRITKLLIGDDSISYTYDRAGRVIQTNRSNKTSSLFTYNANGKLTSLLHNTSGDTVISVVYHYDASGNVSDMKLDFPHKLDFSSIDLMAGISYNNLNQLTTDGTNNYTYDPRGNLIDISGVRTFHASYTGEDILDSLSTSSLQASYRVNALQDVFFEEKNGIIRNLFYDLDHKLLFETDNTGKVIRKYFYSGRTLAAMVDENNNIYFYHLDKSGNVIALTNSSGKEVAAYWYSPYGEKIYDETTLENRFTFVGSLGVVDIGKGFYRMGLRVYDAHLGRFIQRDPYGMRNGTDLYVYAKNNPMAFIDPYGTQIANGTADLFSCEGPVYGDDFISETTAQNIKKAVDIVTDYAPEVSDVKAAGKSIYHISQGNYTQASKDVISIGLNKLTLLKNAGKIMENVGGKIAGAITDMVVGAGTDAVVDKAGDAIKKGMSQPPAHSPSTGFGGSHFPMSPPVGIHY